MPAPKVRQFAGDFRLWRKANDGTMIPVIPEPTDPEGNQPIETDAASFSYEAGEQVITDGAQYLEDGEEVTLAEPVAHNRE